jgi:hypothetical protein
VADVAVDAARLVAVTGTTRLFVVSGVAMWAGLALVLSRLRWFSRLPLSERLRPYAPGGWGTPRQAGLLTFESFRDVVGPLARGVGERTARLFGVSEPLGLRLERIHSPLDVTNFRVRQLGWAVVALATAAAASAALHLAVALTTLAVLGAPLLALLVLEQQVASASAHWQRRLFLELPVVAEQLAMLLSAGYSLGSAMNRVATRSKGCCAADLRRVVLRVRQGLSEAEALREWAAVARVDAVDRLVPVLALSGQTGDLGRLLSDEARAVRREVHRRLVETMERRAQTVWVPVTVAALVPGVLFLAIPFVEALRLFSAS